LSLVWMRAVRFAGFRRMRFSRRAVLDVGVFPIRDHFYDPHFHPRHLPADYDQRDRDLPGIDLDVKGQLAFLAQFDFADELREIAGTGTPRLNADNFGAGDSEFLYSVVRRFKPKRVFEIGSGNSSLIALAALTRNASEDPARGGALTCI